MARLRLANQLQAVIREVGLDRACVFSGRAALDELARLERVDDPRDPAQAEAGRVGQRGQSHCAAVGGGEAAKTFDAAQREAVLGLQLGVERTCEALVRLEHADPRILVRVGPGREAVVTDDVRTSLAVCFGGHYLLTQ